MAEFACLPPEINRLIDSFVEGQLEVEHLQFMEDHSPTRIRGKLDKRLEEIRAMYAQQSRFQQLVKALYDVTIIKLELAAEMGFSRVDFDAYEVLVNQQVSLSLSLVRFPI